MRDRGMATGVRELWLELTGIGLATGNAASLATSAAVPLIGIPEAYPAYARQTKRSRGRPHRADGP